MADAQNLQVSFKSDSTSKLKAPEEQKLNVRFLSDDKNRIHLDAEVLSKAPSENQKIDVKFLSDEKNRIHLDMEMFSKLSAVGFVKSATTQEWNVQRTLISNRNMIYVYTDRTTIDNGDGTYTLVPGIKIGDGKAYLIDLPFMAVEDPGLDVHMNNMAVHVTAEEKDSWNNKWRGYIDPNDSENLIFTTD